MLGIAEADGAALAVAVAVAVAIVGVVVGTLLATVVGAICGGGPSWGTSCSGGGPSPTGWLLAQLATLAVAPANAMPPNTMTRSRRSSFTEARLPTIGCVSPVEIAVSGCSHAEARA